LRPGCIHGHGSLPPWPCRPYREHEPIIPRPGSICRQSSTPLDSRLRCPAVALSPTFGTAEGFPIARERTPVEGPAAKRSASPKTSSCCPFAGVASSFVVAGSPSHRPPVHAGLGGKE